MVEPCAGQAEDVLPIQEPFQSDATLVDLPVDVLSLVVVRLGFLDRFRCRAVCKILRVACDSAVVWAQDDPIAWENALSLAEGDEHVASLSVARTHLLHSNWCATADISNCIGVGTIVYGAGPVTRTAVVDLECSGSDSVLLGVGSGQLCLRIFDPSFGLQELARVGLTRDWHPTMTAEYNAGLLDIARAPCPATASRTRVATAGRGGFICVSDVDVNDIACRARIIAGEKRRAAEGSSAEPARYFIEVPGKPGIERPPPCERSCLSVPLDQSPVLQVGRSSSEDVIVNVSLSADGRRVMAPREGLLSYAQLPDCSATQPLGDSAFSPIGMSSLHEMLPGSPYLVRSFCTDEAQNCAALLVERSKRLSQSSNALAMLDVGADRIVRAWNEELLTASNPSGQFGAVTVAMSASCDLVACGTTAGNARVIDTRISSSASVVFIPGIQLSGCQTLYLKFLCDHELMIGSMALYVVDLRAMPKSDVRWLWSDVPNSLPESHSAHVCKARFMPSSVKGVFIDHKRMRLFTSCWSGNLLMGSIACQMRV